MSKEELFDGIQIMSPQEIESSLDTSSESTSEGEETTETQESAPEFEITSPNDSKEGDESEDSASIEPVEESSEVEESGPNAYSALIKDLVSEGVLTGPEGDELEEVLKDASSETVKKFVQNTVEKSFQAKQENWKKNLDPTKKRFLEIEDAFNETDTAIQMAQRLEFFENLSTEAVAEDENLQKNIYYEYLKERGFSDAEAAEAIEDASAVDKLQDKALKAIPALKNNAEAYVENSRKQKQAEMQQQRQANEEAFNRLINTIEEREEFVPGLKMNKIAKDKLKSNITSSVYQDDKGNKYTSLMYKQMRNPAEFEMLINYYDTLGLFNLDSSGKFKPDISKLKNVAKTKAVSELDKVLAKENSKGIGQGNSMASSDKTKSALDLLERAFNKGKRK